ncbi:hypothetical protein TNCT_623761 [Trichonephila clavata]|uniref:Uncharacterized protein n=1 Tax=Trichonephila clavata TaxID=2740835 RepID=A0A8X6KQH4_TRICU|nr:hypothetical protein TNCT_623761 [Trichonephila clavata]
MISRRKILSRSRDELNVDLGLEEDEDAWFTKERLFRIFVSIYLLSFTHEATAQDGPRPSEPQKVPITTSRNQTPTILSFKDQTNLLYGFYPYNSFASVTWSTRKNFF